MADPVTGGVARALARAMIGSYVSAGLGSNAIINVFRDLGIGYRRTTMLEDIRQITGLARLENTVKNLPSNLLFPQYGMVQSYLRRARRYRVYVRATVEDLKTGESFEKMTSFYTDSRMSKDDWESTWLDQFAESASGKMFGVVDGRIASVEHNVGFDY